MKFIRRNASDVASDDVLRAYGVALALVVSLTAFHWLTRQPLRDILSPSTVPICWPILPHCHVLRGWSSEVWNGIAIALLALGAVNAALFLERRTARAGFYMLLLLFVVKTAILVQDYRFILNQHYMAGWATLVFLFGRRRRDLLPRLIVAMYFWAGLLKPNHSWLSGAALGGFRPLNLPDEWIPAACAYVLVLELAISFALLSKNHWVFSAALAQFALFHIASYWVVGAFYPILMSLILVILVANRLPILGASIPPSDGVNSAVLPASLAMIGAFSVFQMIPVIIPGDAALTGEGRMVALHMFDDITECRNAVTSRSSVGPLVTQQLTAPYLHNRIQCDPLVYWSLANELCRTRPDPTSDFDLLLETRRTTEADYRVLVDVPAFCATAPSYRWWRHNSWIKIPDS